MPRQWPKWLTFICCCCLHLPATYPGLGPRGSSLSGEVQTLPSAPLWESWGIPRQAKRYNLSRVSWFSSQMDIPETPPRGDIQETTWPDPQTTSTGSSSCTIAALPAPLGFQSSSPGWSQPPKRGNCFQQLVLVIWSFRSLPKAHDHKWGLECRLTGNERAIHPFQLPMTMVSNLDKLIFILTSSHSAANCHSESWRPKGWHHQQKERWATMGTNPSS